MVEMILTSFLFNIRIALSVPLFECVFPSLISSSHWQQARWTMISLWYKVWFRIKQRPLSHICARTESRSIHILKRYGINLRAGRRRHMIKKVFEQMNIVNAYHNCQRVNNVMHPQKQKWKKNYQYQFNRLHLCTLPQSYGYHLDIYNLMHQKGSASRGAYPCSHIRSR